MERVLPCVQFAKVTLDPFRSLEGGGNLVGRPRVERRRLDRPADGYRLGAWIDRQRDNQDLFADRPEQLETIIDPETDSLRFYFLGSSRQTRIEHVGAKCVPQLGGPLIL